MLKTRLSLLLLLVGLTIPSLPAAKKKGTRADATKPTTEQNAEHKGKTAPSSPVDLNSASEKELDSLPGVGVPTAKKIIANRPYSSVDDLAKAGIAKKTIDQIRPMVMAGGGRPAAAAAAAASASPSTPSPSKKPYSPAPVPQTPSAAPASSGTADRGAAPAGAPGQVWVNLETKVYHRAGDRWYGKTKKGQYMSESDAIQKGYRASKE